MMYRILIVEDDRVIAKAIYKQVQSWGYEAGGFFKGAGDFCPVSSPTGVAGYFPALL